MVAMPPSACNPLAILSRKAGSHDPAYMAEAPPESSNPAVGKISNAAKKSEAPKVKLAHLSRLVVLD
jgi:hypothetical protein